MDFRRHLGGLHGGGRRSGWRSNRFGHGRRALLRGPTGGLQAAADRRRQFRLCGGDDRHTEVLGQRRRDQRDAGTAARGGDGNQGARPGPTAVNGLLQHAGEVGERLPDRVVELIAGEAHVAAVPGQVGDQRGGRGGRQPFLGRAALRPQPAQRTDRGRARHIDRTGIGQAFQHLRQHSLVDQVTGELGVPDGRADRLIAVGGFDQRDARPAATEVAQCDQPAGRHAGIVPQRREGRGRVGDQCRPGELGDPG